MPASAVIGRRVIYLSAALLLAAGLGWAVVQWRRDRAPSPDDPNAARGESPYRNTRPGVAYVGDDACRGCHPNYYQHFRRHPMGQSLGPLGDVLALEQFDASAHPKFTAAGFEYEVLRKGNALIHRESVRDADGKLVGSREAEVSYVLGSGAHGRSYVVNLDGRLFLSPISWYTQAKRWDLAPQYEQSNFHFERPANEDCLFCHSNRVQAKADTVNQYEKPLFRGHAIGCERCHGPGELHTREQQALDVHPYSIVDPKKLPPLLRDAVCEQCHLQGVARIARRDREEFDYRPGLPLSDYLAVFVKARELTFNKRAVGQVELMVSSQCYLKSNGKLGCISCHDPHELPAPETKAAYYRDRCLKCHGQDAPTCSLPADVRRDKNQNDCVACHMPHFASTDVAHAAATDHRVLSGRGEPTPTEQPTMLPPWEPPLVAFHQKQLPAGTTLKRELGIALTQVGLVEHQPNAFQLALPRLQESLDARPDDLPALKSKGIALVHQSSPQEALKVFEKMLALSPEHENALTWAAGLAEQLGQLEQAEAFWRRALKVNPYFSNYHLSLARVLFRREKYGEAAREATTALEMNPTRLDARRFLIGCHLRQGERETAQREWETYQKLHPPDLEEVRKLMNEKR